MAEIYSDINPAVLRSVPRNTAVLDIGCGTGILGAELKKKKGCVVYGIDYDKESVEIAKKRLDFAVKTNIEETIPRMNKKFDVIIFADILEHLRNPEEVLKKYLRFLKPNGIVVVSLPNIANWTIRLRLLFGNFTPADTGILDRTHLHFYTLKTARRLLVKSGLRITRTDLTTNFVRSPMKAVMELLGKKHSHVRYEKMFESPAYKFYEKVVMPVETVVARLWKRLFAYQLVFVARKR